MWRDIFSADNIFAYARTALELSQFLRTLFLEGYDSIVIPSRGAYPIFSPAVAAWDIENKCHNELADRMNANLELVSSPIHRELILPFSADPLQKTQTTKAIRKFWVKVLSAIVRREGTSPHLLFYRFTIEKLAKLKWCDATPRRLPSPKFIFIDTVISGQAICEMLDAFEEEGLTDCYFLLIVDQDGKAIKSEYRPRIQALVDQNRCATVYVRNLFTEDRGPAVSGVWSTVYPGVMERLNGRYTWSKDCYGAGSFYWKVSSSHGKNDLVRENPEYNMPVTVLFASLSENFFSAVKTLVEIDLLKRSGHLPPFPALRLKNGAIEKQTNTRLEQSRRLIEYSMCTAIEHLGEFKGLSPLRRSTTEQLSTPRVKEKWPTAQVTVSSSHLVRVGLSDDDIEKLFTIFEHTYLDGRLDAFSEMGWWFQN